MRDKSRSGGLCSQEKAAGNWSKHNLYIEILREWSFLRQGFSECGFQVLSFGALLGAGRNAVGLLDSWLPQGGRGGSESPQLVGHQDGLDGKLPQPVGRLTP